MVPSSRPAGMPRWPKAMLPILLALGLALPASIAQAQAVQTQTSSDSLVVHAGQSRIIRFPFPIRRVAVADPGVSDFRVISSQEVYILGKALGRTTVQLWTRDGVPFTYLVDVVIDPEPLRGQILTALPDETGVEVKTAGGSLILAGTVSDDVAAQAVLKIAEGYAGIMSRQISRSGGAGANSSGQQGAPAVGVVDRMRLRDMRQVKLEVRIAEVSKSLVDRLGLNVIAGDSSGDFRWSIGSGFLGTGGGTAGLSFTSGANSVQVNLDAEAKRGQLKILAEPTIIAVSGKEANFLVGGKVFIPIPQGGNGGSGQGAITLEEREYGVGLKFTPTVHDDDRIMLAVAPEVSEISREPLRFGSGGNVSVLPSFSSSKVSTTVQLRNGQSLMIGGLLRDTSSKTVRTFPLLGDVPILGELFRSKDFAQDRSELVIIVHATLVEPDDKAPGLPSAFEEPAKAGKNESSLAGDAVR